jgi:putative flippase GtrA
LSIVELVARFGIVGIAATLTYFVVANVLIMSGIMAPPIASVVGYAAGMVTSFVGQSRFTFNLREVRRSHLVRFAVLSAAGIFVSYWSVELGRTLGFPSFVGTVATSVLIPVISFVVMKFWVFVERDR